MKESYYLVDKWRSDPRRVNSATALAVLADHRMPKELAIGMSDFEFKRDLVLIVAQYENEWRILDPDNETLCSIPQDVYAPEVVLRTAHAIFEDLLKFRPHEVVLGSSKRFPSPSQGSKTEA